VAVIKANRVTNTLPAGAGSLKSDSARNNRSLLNRAGHTRERVIGIRSNQTDRSDHQNQNYRQHHGVFGDVLPRIFRPNSVNKFRHALLQGPALRGKISSMRAIMRAGTGPCQMRFLMISTEYNDETKIFQCRKARQMWRFQTVQIVAPSAQIVAPSPVRSAAHIATRN